MKNDHTILKEVQCAALLSSDHLDFFLYAVTNYTTIVKRNAAFQKRENAQLLSSNRWHAVSESCHASTCEVYEIWNGAAYIYMQEHDADDPGRCFAVYARAGEVVIVPPGWAHYTINANINEPMLFGAWCVRDYGFDYEGIRAHNGVAYFPKVRNGRIEFVKNGRYSDSGLEIVSAGGYQEFGLEKGVPIYTQYEKNKDLFRFVTDPACAGELWEGYRP